MRPTSIDSVSGLDFVDVSCGLANAIAVTSTHDVYAWGLNSHFQCGIDTQGANIMEPRLVSSLQGIKIAGISCGAAHVIAVTNLGMAMSWGMNTNG